MNYRAQLLVVVLILALTSLACGFNTNLPITKIETGPLQTKEIELPVAGDPASGLELNLEFVMGELILAPGASEYLATGSASFNVSKLEPKIEMNGLSYTLSTGDQDIRGFPINTDDLKNEWELKLGVTPMSLTINAGAYNGHFELGGLSLENLAIEEAGSNVTCSFSAPNLVEMSNFTYSTGGSTIELKGLANANFEQMTLNAGAGNYSLSFDGELKRDANVSIDAGASTVTIIVPKGVNALVNYDGGLSSVKVDNEWKQDGTVYSLSGSGPTLTITVKLGIGTLNLKTS